MKFTFLIIFFFILQPVWLFGQNADSVFVKDSIDIPEVVSPEFWVNQAKEHENKPKTAIILYRKALEAKTEEISPNWEGDIHVSLARLLFKSSESKQAFKELLTAQAIFSESANVAGQLDVITEMANYYEKTGDYKEAERYLHLVMKMQEVSGLSAAIPDVSYRLSNLYFRKKEFDKAEKSVVSAINEFELNNEKEKTADSYMLLADIKRSQKNTRESEKLILKRALPVYSSIDNKQGRIDCFNLLGSIYYDQRRFSESKWFYIQSNTQYRNLKDDKGIITSLVNLAKVKSAIGDNKSALKDFKEAEALARKNKNTSLVAYVKSAFTKYYNKPIKVNAVAKAKTPAKKAMNETGLKAAGKESKTTVIED